MHPRDFFSEYVLPSVATYNAQQSSTHLAIHAISQIDILSEVVANHIGKKAKKLRDQLGQKHPALAKIRDAHDTHKHGQLDRNTALFVSQGQRPGPKTGYGFFMNRSFIGRPLTPYAYLGITLNDGSTEKVYTLINDGLKAWEQELGDLGL